MTSFERISDNVLVIRREDLNFADPTYIVDGDTYSYFRGGSEAIYTKKPVSQLSGDEIQEINRVADRFEGKMNKAVKRDLSDSLTKFFNNESYKIYEFGCGKYPLIDYFPDYIKPDYHGIEKDSHHINSLQNKGVKATNWSTVMSEQAADHQTSICTSVYALHFMVQDKLAKRIAHLTSEDGFFVGNFYLKPAELKSGEQREHLKAILERHQMSYMVVDDPNHKCNEYWIIYNDQAAEQAGAYANVLKETIENRPK